MRVLILASGGDGAGMNMALYELTKGLQKHEVLYCYRGLEGLINGEIKPSNLQLANEWKNKGGILIKTSRSKRFTTNEGFEKAKQTLKNNLIDKLIILGGNGSYLAAQKLKKVVDVIFIPCTIDNDFSGSDYTIGFDTAVQNSVGYINNVQQTFYSFSRIGIYEVMGRDSDEIAKKVGEIVNADMIISKDISAEKIANKIKKMNNENKSPIIIVKEHLCDVYNLANQIEGLTGKEIRGAIIGYIQRGGEPTKFENYMAKNFAKFAVKNIKLNNFSVVFKNKIFKTKNI